jgi:hypothetical protein
MTLLLVKMKEKKLLKIQSSPEVLRVQAIPESNYVTYICYMRATGVCKIIAHRATVSNGLFFSVAVLLLVVNVKKKHTQCKIEILLLVKMKEKKLLKIRSLPKGLRAQALRSTT